jgi:DNA-binding PadR family transcriptional regulator
MNPMENIEKKVQIKLIKGLLDFILLQFLHVQPMHGYELIATVRKIFGIYFGPSTVYPLLATLEKNAYIASNWNTENDRPRKIYTITNEGNTLLNSTETTLDTIRQKTDLYPDDDLPQQQE